MKKFLPPDLMVDLACIASSDVDIEFLSIICCYVNEPNKYLPIFEMPVISSKFEEVEDIYSDNYFPSIVIKKSTVQMMNSLARARCSRIILVGLSEEQKKYLKLEKYWKVTFFDIHSINEINDKLKFLNKQFKGFFNCNRADISKGLLHAKDNNKLLVVDNAAPRISDYIKREDKEKGLIVLESKNDVLDIIILNYAYSVNADVKLINHFNPSEIKEIRSNFIKWKRDQSHTAYLRIRTYIENIFEDINVADYEYLTFFSDGIPYGVFFNSVIPCSHVIRSNTLDIFLYNNIIYEQFNNNFDSAIVFSPELSDLNYTKKEHIEVCNSLLDARFFVKKLINKYAKVEAFSYYGSHYPYDILHICSHGGQIDGYYVVHEFTDRMGINHTIEYEEVVGFSLDEQEKDYVNVVSKKIFKFFDNLIWDSDELDNENYPKYIYTDMFNSIRCEDENSKITREKIDLIETSCHVRCYDSIHQGQFHVLASQNYPFIFNNTCNSWPEFSDQLIASGCRAYIGTLWKIGDEIAACSANIFYRNAFNDNIINTANKMINSIEDEKYKDIYLFCGLHFSCLKVSKMLSKKKVIIELSRYLYQWLEKSQKENTQDVLLNTKKIIQFICMELVPYYELPGMVELLARAARTCFYLDGKLSD
ncbi:MAG: hypothetical protein CVU84_15210 [Firmicutes bacterium HGW-Firmicutes-1]|jgi:hypothetical protein|nr:MAG: hypothetical protein CVU84_15210 [Firmicutes bacterium HGW-Firmicutes-1]